MTTMSNVNDARNLETDLFSIINWSEKKVSLRDFADVNVLPGLALIVHGRYRNIGAATNGGSSGGSTDGGKVSNVPKSNVVFIQSIQRTQKVLMESVKRHPGGRHVIATGQKYSLPLTYRGWFEVLSEDFRSCRPLSSVEELAKLWPHEFIVREKIRALVSGAPNGTSTNNLMTTRLERSRIIQPGERLKLHDEVVVTVESPPGKMPPVIAPVRRYLRCIDEQGNTAFLSIEQKANISPVSGPNNISGVHDIMSLLDKFRLPLTVHLVCGYVPPTTDKSFTPVFRLLGIYEDETAFVLPLHPPPATAPSAVHRGGHQRLDSVESKSDSSFSLVSDSGRSVIHSAGKMLSVSTREPLILAPALNATQLAQRADFKTIRQRCDAMVASYANSIHVLVAGMQPDSEALARGAERLRAVQSMTAANYDREESIVSHSCIDETEVECIFDEIDDIYRYVREGGNPPPSRTRPSTKSLNSSRPVGVNAAPSGGTWVMKSSMDIIDDGPIETDDDTYARIDDVVKTAAADAPKKRPTASADDQNFSAWAKVQDYCWEEPIYADIDKIRERKRMSNVVNDNRCAKSRDNLIDSGTTVDAYGASAVNILQHGELSDQQRIDESTKTSRSDEILIPVGNLRQLIRRSCMKEQPGKSSTTSNISQPPAEQSPVTNISLRSPGNADQAVCNERNFLRQVERSHVTAATCSGSVYNNGAITSFTSMSDQKTGELYSSFPTSSPQATDYDQRLYQQAATTAASTTTTMATKTTINSRSPLIMNRSSINPQKNTSGVHQPPTYADAMRRFDSPADETMTQKTLVIIPNDVTRKNSGQILTFTPASSDSTDTDQEPPSSSSSVQQHVSQPQQLSSSSNHPVSKLAVNSPWFDPSEHAEAITTPSVVSPVQGTTAVVVSRAGPRLVQQHQYRAANAAEAAAPVSRYSRIAVSGGTPIVVLQTPSNQVQQMNDGGQAANVTRISTLGRRCASQYGEERSQSAA